MDRGVRRASPLGGSGGHTTGASGGLPDTEQCREAAVADLPVLVLIPTAHGMSSTSALDGLKRRASGDQHSTLRG